MLVNDITFVHVITKDPKRSRRVRIFDVNDILYPNPIICDLAVTLAPALLMLPDWQPRCCGSLGSLGSPVSPSLDLCKFVNELSPTTRDRDIHETQHGMHACVIKLQKITHKKG